jgi:hypothetical protein
MAGVILGSAAIAGGAYVVEVYPKRVHNENELTNARLAQIGQINTSKKTGAHIPTLTGEVILLNGSNIRSSATETSSKYHYNLILKKDDLVPGNIIDTVGEDGDEALVLTDPIIVQNSDSGAYWVQAVKEPTKGGSNEKGSATALADATISANLTGLLEQGRALVCNQGEAGYATVNRNFGYVSADGKATAEYQSITSVADAFRYVESQDGGLNCTDELK